MMTRNDLLDYKHDCGTQAAADLLLLIGPDHFDGDYEAMEEELSEVTWHVVLKEGEEDWWSRPNIQEFTDLEEAKAALRAQGSGSIAVLDEDGTFCYDEIPFNEI